MPLIRVLALLLVAPLGLTACGEADRADPEGTPAAAPAPPAPRLVERAVAYADGETALEGHFAYDAARSGPLPVVFVVHEWWGLGEHARERARRLAGLGYAAFCVDMYGKGRLTDEFESAQAWSGEIYADLRGIGVRRLEAGRRALLEAARADGPELAADRAAAIGFCFGGTLVLEWAWSGADLRAVVCFHGNPRPPAAEEAAGVKAAVLVCHGAADPLVTQEALQELRDGLRATPVDFTFVEYAGARHSFTSPEADTRGFDAVGYHPAADRRSWEHMRALLAEKLGG